MTGASAKMAWTGSAMIPPRPAFLLPQVAQVSPHRNPHASCIQSHIIPISYHYKGKLRNARSGSTGLISYVLAPLLPDRRESTDPGWTSGIFLALCRETGPAHARLP